MEKGLLEESSYYFNPNQFLGPDFSWRGSLMAPFNKIWPGGNQPAGTAFNTWWDKNMSAGGGAPAPSALGV